MTLTQGRFISYEYDRMVVLFSMHDDEKEIHCAISTSAMDELEGGTLGRAGHRETQFMRLRERIEACADGKYQAKEFEGAPPRIVLRSIDFRKPR
ncbi:MAG TPA: DUF1488 family protein [Afipia sp.]